MARCPTLLTHAWTPTARLLRQALRLLSSGPAKASQAPLSLRGASPLPLHQSPKPIPVLRYNADVTLN